MEICKIKIQKSLLWGLVAMGSLKTGDYEVITVDEPDYDYKEDAIWAAAKERSDKYFRELKKIEFEIRTNHK